MSLQLEFPTVELDPTIVAALPNNYMQRRGLLLQIARFAENSDRFEDMCKVMKAIVELDHFASENRFEDAITLTVEERNLLSVAYKNIVSSRRSSWRSLQSANNEDEATAGQYITVYMKQLESELTVISSEILDLLTKFLIPAYYNSLKQKKPLSKEYGVFYLKMAGDYYRYLAEIMDVQYGAHESARTHYQSALDLADSSDGNDGKIASTHPVRLGLALNFSVCYYETLGQIQKAVALAQKTFEEALEDLDVLSEQAYKDSTMILQLLKDNLSLWTRE